MLQAINNESGAFAMADNRRREPIRFLVFSASLRRQSFNSELARLAAVTIEANEGEVDLASMRDFDTPSYNADVQDSEGFPQGAEDSAAASRPATASWWPRRKTTPRCR